MPNLFETLTHTVKHWYIPLLFGILFLIFGIYVFSVPLTTYVTLSIFFSVSFLFSGITEIFFSLQNSKSLQGWGWFLVSGLLTTAIGIYLIANPQISMTVLPFVIGFTLLFRSFQLLGFAFDMKSMRIMSWGNIALASVGGIIFSLLLIFNPVFTGISLVTLTGVSFIFMGIASIMLALDLRKVKKIPGKVSQELKDRIKAIQEEIDQLKK
ncbi:HdeD family acid-resistance protein [Chryseobacterium flavum]|uniref:HdeD family acid-resistance protein n=1 Tax=Chryseobacterium flavum TaxID=415851 RepID=UPI0028ABFB67|nr:HdeD family acid-resistance protein [Chryseobacterium flavum]